MTNLLTWIIFLPVLTALLLIVLSFTRRPELAKYVALASTLLNLLVALLALGRFTVGEGLQLGMSAPWIPSFNVSYAVGVDGLSLLMVILTNILMVISVLCSFTAIDKRQWEYYFFLLLLQTGINGTFCALDLFLFYVFWEIMLIPLYFLIGIWGSDNRRYATMKFVLYTLVGSLLMLVGVLYLYFKARGLQIASFHYTEILDLIRGGALQFSDTEEILLFLAFFFAFAIKVPLFPFHTWLPDAHTEAPTAGSIILAGVLLKTGAYGILRFCIPFFPQAAVTLAPYICWLAVIAIIYGAATAIAQQDMKRLVAYSSVSHMGFVVLGIFAFTTLGLTGGILQMVNHGISTSGLFLGVGILYERRHTRLMSEFGGLAGVMGRYCVLMVIIVLSSAGLPGLNGFVGEFMILAGTFIQDAPAQAAAWSRGRIWALLAASGVVLGAVYLLIMVQKVFFGKLNKEENKTLPDLNLRELVCMLSLIFFAFWIGLYPKPWTNLIERSYAVTTIRDSIAPVQAAQRDSTGPSSAKIQIAGNL